MSDYRYQDPEDPFRDDAKLDPNTNPPAQAWGWIAAAIFVVVVLGVAFGLGRGPGQLGTNTASNDMTPPAVTHMAPPVNAQPPAATPAPTTQATPPVTPAPAAPAEQPNSGQ
jgi:hypothetical protein